jgi:hypothetical protein
MVERVSIPGLQKYCIHIYLYLDVSILSVPLPRIGRDFTAIAIAGGGHAIIIQRRGRHPRLDERALPLADVEVLELEDVRRRAKNRRDF